MVSENQNVALKTILIGSTLWSGTESFRCLSRFLQRVSGCGKRRADLVFISIHDGIQKA